MYISLKRLLREILTRILIKKTDKICEQELIDEEKIVQKYGRGTYVLNLYYKDYILSGTRFFKWFFIIGGSFFIVFLIAYLLCGQVFSSEEKWCYGVILCICIIFPILIKINEDIYKYYKNIITKDKIIMRRAYKKDRIVTYEEISEAAKKKRIVVKKAIMYIPTRKKPLRIEIFGNVFSELALDQIKQKSKIAIPELTGKRKKYIGQAAMSGLYNFFGLLLAGFTLTAAGLWSADNGVSYFASYTMLPMNMFAIVTIGCFMIGKIYYMIGHYRLRKDINDPEHVRIRL